MRPILMFQFTLLLFVSFSITNAMPFVPGLSTIQSVYNFCQRWQSSTGETPAAKLLDIMVNVVKEEAEAQVGNVQQAINIGEMAIRVLRENGLYDQLLNYLLKQNNKSYQAQAAHVLRKLKEIADRAEQNGHSLSAEMTKQLKEHDQIKEIICLIEQLPEQSLHDAKGFQKLLEKIGSNKLVKRFNQYSAIVNDFVLGDQAEVYDTKAPTMMLRAESQEYLLRELRENFFNGYDGDGEQVERFLYYYGNQPGKLDGLHESFDNWAKENELIYETEEDRARARLDIKYSAEREAIKKVVDTQMAKTKINESVWPHEYNMALLGLLYRLGWLIGASHKNRGLHYLKKEGWEMEVQLDRMARMQDIIGHWFADHAKRHMNGWTGQIEMSIQELVWI